MAGKKILIVDDAATVRMFQKLILQREGYALEEATNGAEAVERVKVSLPDIILLDVMMPKMNGIECCRTLKSADETKHIPIIMVTTLGDQTQIREAYAAGCDDYVTKPINKVKLVTKIRQLLNRS